MTGQGAARLEGRTALVTGASRGIGLAVARALAEAGARVAVTARAGGPLTAAAAEIGATALPADVSSAEQVSALGKRVASLFGAAPDFLVNSAGTFALASFADTTAAMFDEQIAANLRGPFLVTREFLPGMLARGEGHVVSIGSVAGRTAFPGNAAYAASKFGLRGMHEVLAQEVQGTGVRTTLLEPAATDTALWDPLDPDHRADLPSRSAMLRAEDVARAVAFVFSQPPGVEIPLLAIRANR